MSILNAVNVDVTQWEMGTSLDHAHYGYVCHRVGLFRECCTFRLPL